jgi:hypothetical protein
VTSCNRNYCTYEWSQPRRWPVTSQLQWQNPNPMTTAPQPAIEALYRLWSSAELKYLKMAVLWDVPPRSLAEVYRRFRGAVSLSETLGNFYQTTQQPRRQYLHTRRRENLKYLFPCWMTYYIIHVNLRNNVQWPLQWPDLRNKLNESTYF